MDLNLLPKEPKQTAQKYAVYRCLEPGHTETGTPWWPSQNYCPCDPKLSDPTGRGSMGCPFGVQFDQAEISAAANRKQPLMTVVGSNQGQGGSTYQTKAVPASLPGGSMFPTKQNAPPQADPRPLVRIGQEWRSAWA